MKGAKCHEQKEGHPRVAVSKERMKRAHAAIKCRATKKVEGESQLAKERQFLDLSLHFHIALRGVRIDAVD